MAYTFSLFFSNLAYVSIRARIAGLDKHGDCATLAVGCLAAKKELRTGNHEVWQKSTRCRLTPHWTLVFFPFRSVNSLNRVSQRQLTRACMSVGARCSATRIEGGLVNRSAGRSATTTQTDFLEIHY